MNEIFLNTFEPNIHVNLYVQCIFKCLNYVPISEHNVKCTDVYAMISDPTCYDIVSSLAGQRYLSVLACEFTGKLSNPPLSRCYILSLRLRDPSFINNQLLNLLIEIND